MKACRSPHKLDYYKLSMILHIIKTRTTIDPFHNDVERARPLAKTRQVMFQIYPQQCSVMGKSYSFTFAIILLKIRSKMDRNMDSILNQAPENKC